MKAFFENESDLKKFLDKGGSICREERQFVLFLYLLFLKKKQKETKGQNEKYINETVNKCLCIKSSQNVDIVDVYFEATLMRDYWKYFKKNGKEKGAVPEEAFNRKALHFSLDFQLGVEKATEVIDKLLCNNQKLITEYLGQREWKETICRTYSEVEHLIKKDSITEAEKQKMKTKASLDIAGMMMNVTPDILVIYKMDNKLYAKALECKYLSAEGKYRDVAGAKSKMQLFIQECIMSFCFGRNGNTDNQRHIPHFPQSPVWEGKELLWEETCERVYKGILNQEVETSTIKNCGVEMVRFIDKEKKVNKGEDSEILVDLKELLEKMY